MNLFQDPFALLAIPFVWFALWRVQRSRHRPTVLFSSLAGLRSLPRTAAGRWKRLLPLLPATGLALLVLALARPAATHVSVNAFTEGIAIQLVLDRSQSMLLTDLDEDPFDRRTVTRLDVVKEVVRDFVDPLEEEERLDERARPRRNVLPGRPNDRLGLIAFAGYVQPLCPITLDHEALLTSLRGIEAARPQAFDNESHLTAMGDALATAVDRLRDVEARSKVIVLLTDGESNVGAVTPSAAAEIAAAEGIRVHTIGVGRSDLGLDESTLAAIAERTGGLYQSATERGELERIYAELDTLETSRNPAFQRVQRFDRYRLPLLVGLGLLALHLLLVSTRFRSLP